MELSRERLVLFSGAGLLGVWLLYPLLIVCLVDPASAGMVNLRAGLSDF